MDSNNITIRVKNHAMLEVKCERSLQQELSESFSFYAHNYKYMPMYKNGMWDGKIRLFNNNTREIGVGLYPRIKKWCDNRNYTLTIEKTKYGTPLEQWHIEVDYLYKFIQELNLPFKIMPEQFNAVYKAIKNKRMVIKSPTGSGKSLIIYVIIRFYLAHQGPKGNIVIVVPTVSLVEQMFSDFAEYGFNSEDYCHKIYSGADKNNIKKPVTITTWQSIYKLPKKWFDQFGCVIGDECHQFKAKCLSTIMNKSEQASYRIGTTGTLDGTEVNQLTLESLFGPVFTSTTTAELQEKGVLADLNIKMIHLNHSEKILPVLPKKKKLDYKKEIDILVTNEKRNRYIVNLAKSLKGNTLVLFNFVEKQGDVLDAMFKEHDLNAYYYLSGKTAKEDREYVRKIVNTKKTSVTLASYGIFSTGINIKNIHNVVFASPYKSQVRVLQSIGRGLRLSDNGMYTTLYDIFDSYGTKQKYSFAHALARQQIYKREKFKFKTYKVNLE